MLMTRDAGALADHVALDLGEQREEATPAFATPSRMVTIVGHSSPKTTKLRDRWTSDKIFG